MIAIGVGIFLTLIGVLVAQHALGSLRADELKPRATIETFKETGMGEAPNKDLAPDVDVLRADIEETRVEIGETLEAISERLEPANLARETESDWDTGAASLREGAGAAANGAMQTLGG
jgi:hypothetical protein